VPPLCLAPAPLDAPPSFLERRCRASTSPFPWEPHQSAALHAEIAKTPLLTVEEEVTLAKRIRRANKAARDHMISAKSAPVVKIAMDYKDFGLRCST